MSAGQVIIFDSGVGGFSILREMSSNLRVTYLADQAFFPYGDKKDTELGVRLTAVANWAKVLKPSLFVLACNTATVGGVNLFRSVLTCPVVAVEPVVKMASGFTLILATKRTLASNRLTELQRLHPREISTHTPDGLPQAIEDMNVSNVKKIIEQIKIIADRVQVDSLGLSCTHYPLVKSLFSEIMPNIRLLDPSTAVAREVVRLLPPGQPDKPQATTFVTTGDVLRFKEQITYYLGQYVEPRSLSL